MLGAVAPAHRDPTGQAVPVAAHWAEGTGAVAWLCIRGAPLDATVADRIDRAAQRGGTDASNRVDGDERAGRTGLAHR